MAWGRGDPVAEIDGLIERHSQDKHAWEIQRDDAEVAERQALAAMQAAQDIQQRARQAIELDEAEIDRLLEERAVYVPQQRAGE